MQRRHFHTTRHAARAANATNAYETKHRVIHIDMV